MNELFILLFGISIGGFIGYILHKKYFVEEHAEEINDALERALNEERARLQQEYQMVYMDMMKSLLVAAQITLAQATDKDITVEVAIGEEEENG